MQASKVTGPTRIATSKPCQQRAQRSLKTLAASTTRSHNAFMACAFGATFRNVPAMARSPGISCCAPAKGLGFRLCGGLYSRRVKRTGSTIRAASEPPAAVQEEKIRIAVFVSGGGSNFKAIHAACLDGRVNGEIVAVVSDVPTCGGIQYAAEYGIPTLTFPVPKSGAFPGLSTEELVKALVDTHKADLVLLAGFLKLVPAELVRAYKRKMLNIHPALLPSFGGKGYYGARVHAAVVAAGVRVTGPTVHFVDEEYDKGHIIAQAAVPVYPTDTPQQVAARVLKEEHAIYPMVVAAICAGRVTWRPDGVPIIWNAQ